MTENSGNPSFPCIQRPNVYTGPISIPSGPECVNLTTEPNPDRLYSIEGSEGWVVHRFQKSLNHILVNSVLWEPKQKGNFSSVLHKCKVFTIFLKRKIHSDELVSQKVRS